MSKNTEWKFSVHRNDDHVVDEDTKGIKAITSRWRNEVSPTPDQIEKAKSALNGILNRCPFLLDGFLTDMFKSYEDVKYKREKVFSQAPFRESLLERLKPILPPKLREYFEPREKDTFEAASNVSDSPEPEPIEEKAQEEERSTTKSSPQRRELPDSRPDPVSSATIPTSNPPNFNAETTIKIQPGTGGSNQTDPRNPPKHKHGQPSDCDLVSFLKSWWWALGIGALAILIVACLVCGQENEKDLEDDQDEPPDVEAANLPAAPVVPDEDNESEDEDESEDSNSGDSEESSPDNNDGEPRPQL